MFCTVSKVLFWSFLQKEKKMHFFLIVTFWIGAFILAPQTRRYEEAAAAAHCRVCMLAKHGEHLASSSTHGWLESIKNSRTPAAAALVSLCRLTSVCLLRNRLTCYSQFSEEMKRSPLITVNKKNMTQVFCETVAAELTYHKKQEKSKSHVGEESSPPLPLRPPSVG